MSDAAFLGAIRAAPDDDTARLVYADYLDEQSSPVDAARAEFVRVQVRLAGLDETHPDRPALEDRENELLRTHERAWVGEMSAPLARGLVRWRFERGFLDAVQIAARTLSANGTALFAAHPVSRVRLTALDAAPDSSVQGLAKRVWWANVRDLDAGLAAAPLSKLTAVLRSPHLTGLRRLGVTAHDDTGSDPPRLPALLARLPHLDSLSVRDWRHDPAGLLPALDASGVRTLRLSNGEYSSRGLEALFRSGFAARGGEVHLENGSLGGHLWPAFRAKGARPAVRRMSFGSAPRSAVLELPTLLSAPAAAKLTALDLSETKLSVARVREVIDSGFLLRATDLGLTRCRVGPKGMAALARAAAPHLRRLTLGETALRNDGVFALCDAPWADGLTHLDLMRNGLDDDAVVAMANSGRFVNLRWLDLRVNSPDLGGRCQVAVGDRGVLALASAPNLARLRHLNLYRTRVTVRGVDAVLNAGHCRLSELDLGGYDLGPDLPAVLARSPALARLTKLSLSFTPSLGDDALLPLAESPFLSPLCRLDIRYSGVSRRVCERLTARLGRRLDVYPPP